MNTARLFVSICLVLFCFLKLNAQQDVNQFIEKRSKDIEDLEISEEAKEEWLETLHSFALTPLNLNNATETQLQILGLNDFQIFSLKHYIRETGELLSIYELSHINGFDPETINLIMPFIYVRKTDWKPPLRFDSIAKYNRQDLRLQYRQVLEQSKGYLRTDGKGYQGQPFSTTLRYNFNYFDRLQFSVVADKDAGEPFFDSLQPYGFDHYSIQLTLKQIGILDQLTLGDYRLNFGEGLALSQGFSLSYLNTDAIVKKRSYGITPHRSSSETDHNRGIAANIDVFNTNLFVFASASRNDYSGNLMTTGLHRTPHEIETKDSTTTRMAGLHWAYDRKGLQIGLTAFAYAYKDSLHHQSRDYQQYYFEGKQNSVYSINASYLFKQMRVFGETAVSQNKATAMLFGLQFNLDYKTTLSVSYRNYDKRFQNHYASALSAQSRIANEKAINFAFAHRVSSVFRYYLGCDLFRFPFSTYQSTLSANGFKIKTELIYTPTEQSLIRFLSKLNSRQRDDKNDMPNLKSENYFLAQLTFEYAFNDFIALNARSAYCINRFETASKGMYFYLESLFTLPRLPLKLNLRYAYFDTDDYDSHFSIYEYNLPLSFSTVSVYDKGHRAYIFLRCNLFQDIQLSMRYALTLFSEKQSISSGNDLINSNHKQDIGVQLYFKF
jgi:hypothetical protein